MPSPPLATSTPAPVLCVRRRARSDASEGPGGFGNGSLIVGRTERLPVVTRVFFNISGTASLNPFGLFSRTIMR